MGMSLSMIPIVVASPLGRDSQVLNLVGFRRRRVVAAVAFVAIVALAGATLGSCGGDTSADDGRLQVVASTPVVADLTRQIGGGRIELRTPIDVGVDPHEHEATPADADAVGRADLVVINGAGFEAFLDPLLDQARTVVDASEGVHL